MQPSRDVTEEFEMFVKHVEPGLRRALVGHLPHEQVADGLSEAFGYAWEHWTQVRSMENPAGYLFRVAQTRTRSRREGRLSPPDPPTEPFVEPALMDALRSLPQRQRSVVWLVHGCGWSHAEVGTALCVSASSVGTHLARAMKRLRERLGVTANG